MTITPHHPEDCFNITSTPRTINRFSPTDGPVYDATLFEQIIYRCVDCKYEVAFSDHDFKKHSCLKFSNLSPAENDLMDHYISANHPSLKSFLDFYCPSCHKPTRIYFSDGYGGRHGEYMVGVELGVTMGRE